MFAESVSNYHKHLKQGKLIMVYLLFWASTYQCKVHQGLHRWGCGSQYRSSTARGRHSSPGWSDGWYRSRASRNRRRTWLQLSRGTCKLLCWCPRRDRHYYPYWSLPLYWYSRTFMLKLLKQFKYTDTLEPEKGHTTFQWEKKEV